MKFEYAKSEDARECVAYVDGWGLVIKDENKAITIYDDGSGLEFDSEWKPDDAKQRFYPGDKLTITF